jgi:hypothetical protein
LTTHTLTVSGRVDEKPKQEILSSQARFRETVAGLKRLEGETFYDVQKEECVKVGLIEVTSTEFVGLCSACFKCSVRVFLVYKNIGCTKTKQFVVTSLYEI